MTHMTKISSNDQKPGLPSTSTISRPVLAGVVHPARQGRPRWVEKSLLAVWGIGKTLGKPSTSYISSNPLLEDRKVKFYESPFWIDCSILFWGLRLTADRKTCRKYFRVFCTCFGPSEAGDGRAGNPPWLTEAPLPGSWLNGLSTTAMAWRFMWFQASQPCQISANHTKIGC